MKEGLQWYQTAWIHQENGEHVRFGVKFTQLLSALVYRRSLMKSLNVISLSPEVEFTQCRMATAEPHIHTSRSQVQVLLSLAVPATSCFTRNAD
eukprot:scaffold283331_cov22-Tisochrysis_lutea.AAC.1